MESGVGVKSVQAALGHHTAAFTLDVYGHVTEEMDRDNSTRMNTFIQGLQQP